MDDRVTQSAGQRACSGGAAVRRWLRISSRVEPGGGTSDGPSLFFAPSPLTSQWHSLQRPPQSMRQVTQQQQHSQLSHLLLLLFDGGDEEEVGVMMRANMDGH
jgi:hypothetical protein